MKTLEMWGGVECSLNRVGDNYFNQCEKSGHYRRLSDLKLFADLDIKKLRYPCLWETVAPKDLDHCHWEYLDERLNELKRLNLSFIAGFLHHGSGPNYTSLIDPDFPVKFSTYARLFIQRYPWVNEFTPINEINTTARFSTLSGHWYPHLSSTLYYFKSVLLQCQATVLAMREIRRINPAARLIQTENVGICQSTDVLAYQRDYENERRWLAVDLLCGKVTEHHPLYPSMKESGITDKELSWFQDNNCPPDIIGINHYQMSNRFLDHRLELYPKEFHQSNDIHQYADLQALDTGQAEIISPELILQEAWERYHLPLAVTECHASGPRESQMRWLHEIWKSCLKLQSQGIQIEAVTAWSLLGTYNESYEPGVFDLRNTEMKPQPTALSKMVKELATKGHYDSPVLYSEGAWKTPRRMLWGARTGEFTRLYHHSDARPILITGATGTLGQALAGLCGARNIYFRLLSRREMDISDRDSIEQAIDVYKPWAIINTEGENLQGTANLDRACRDSRVQLVILTSDENLPAFAHECLNHLIDQESKEIHA